MSEFMPVRTSLLAVLFAANGALALAEQTEETRFRVMREISVPATTREELIAVPLDSEVFREAEASLADLRIEGPPGIWNAFVLRTRRTANERHVGWTDTAEEVRLKPLERSEGEASGTEERGIEVRFQASRNRPEAPTEIHLVTPLTNFEQRVRVLDDLSGEVLREGVIFDYSRFMDVRETSIPLPAGDHRRFRVVIDAPTSEQASQLRELTRRLIPNDQNKKGQDGGAEDVVERRMVLDRPFRIDRVELRGTRIESQGEHDIEIEYPVRGLQTSENAESRETIVELTTDRTPTSRLELAVEGRNFSRAATAESGVERDGTVLWQTIGSTTLVHLDFQGHRRENRGISVTPGVYPRLRIRVENRDSPPLRVTGVTLRGPSREIVFIGEPGISYRLHYGARQAAAPQYDVAAIQAALAARSLTVDATLGPHLPGTTTVDARPARRRAPWNDPLILGASIVVLGGLLGIGLVRASRLVGDLPIDDSSPNGPGPSTSASAPPSPPDSPPSAPE